MNDDILTRLLDWIRAIITARKPRQSVPPLFATLEELRWGNGLLRRVNVDPAARPDAVLTYLFIPFRRPREAAPDDWLVTCDLLSGRGGRATNTHQVSILTVPHFARDLSKVAVIYSEPWDLQGRSAYPNSHVRCILFRVAAELRRSQPDSIDWGSAIATARVECWGGFPTVTGPTLLPSPDVWAEPFDPGTRRVRVRLRLVALWLGYLLWEG